MERSVEAMQENNKIEIVEKSVKTGITFGSALAMVILIPWDKFAAQAYTF